MIFTDEDLKRLKEDVNYLFTLTNAQGSALLARLEAAEALCKMVGRVDLRNAGDITEKMNRRRLDMNKAFFDWRKAAGK